MKTYKIIALALAALVTGTFLVNLNEVRTFAASCITQTVTESDIARQPENTPPTRNWVLYTRNSGNAVFRSGPAAPPISVGSLEFTTPTAADKATLFNYDHIGTTLASINGLSYSTYRTTGNDQQVAALNLEADFNGPNAPGGFTTLVFEPVYNTDQGPVVSGTWQQRDAFNGGTAKWWSTKNIPGVCAFNCFVSWNDILAANPDATILGGVGINQGSGNPNLTTAVDAFRFSTTDSCVTYNFDLYAIADNKDQCKNNGWKTFRRADGTGFKNQGDCVSYTNNGK